MTGAAVKATAVYCAKWRLTSLSVVNWPQHSDIGSGRQVDRQTGGQLCSVFCLL